MRRPYRHRHYRPGLPGESRGAVLRALLGILVMVLILAGIGFQVLRQFDAGNTLHRKGVTLKIEEPATVQVSIEGSDLKRAEDGQKLYPGDRITTGAASHAVLSFFDGTVMRLDEGSDLRLEEHVQGEEHSKLSVQVQHGTVWVRTPSQSVWPGSITRRLFTPAMDLSLPSRTEAIVGARSLSVFAADGIGVTIAPGRDRRSTSSDPVIVGEGQKFMLPAEGEEGDDLYVYRSPLDPLAIAAPFLEQSRVSFARNSSVGVQDEDTEDLPPDHDVLVVMSPLNDATVTTATIEISGRVGPEVAHIRANGYALEFNEDERTFRQELALPDQDEIDMTIVALGDGGDVLAEVRRHIRRERRPAVTPIITRPAAAGQTYRTQRERILIEGEADPDTAGIVVNDYRLQLYSPAEKTWRYLAATSMNNLRPGQNVYEVSAINRSGEESEPATITILLAAGQEGIVAEEADTSTELRAGESEESGDAEDASVRPLPNNDPTAPGTLKITSPSSGAKYTATEAFLLEGSTSLQTHSVSVNGYRLQLYEPGKAFWNYIADPDLGTLKKGRNVYRIVARDREGMILDTVRFVVRY